MSTERYDVVILGGGPGGLACAYALASGGVRVALVERERVGGECAFWACVPSKALLRATGPNVASKSVPGSREARAGDADFAAAAAWRTSLVSAYDDFEHARELAAAKVALLRGAAVIVGPGRVRVDAAEIACETIVIATGSEDRLPPLAGLTPGRPYWTSRDASAAGEVPDRLVILGGGAVGVEFAQIFARFGSDVTLVESSAHLLPAEDPATAELVTLHLMADGVRVRTRSKPAHVGWDEAGVHVSFEDAAPIVASRLCVVTGRRPRTRDLGLETVGITCDDGGAIVVDASCRAAAGVFAVGDVTNVAPFTHVAKYQGRIAAASILGSPAHARYDAVPRCLYTSPEVAAVGMTRADARERNLTLLTARVDFDEVTRPVLQSEPAATGALELFADAERGTLAGGWIVGPFASESIGFVTAAIVSAMPLTTLLDVIQPYPTYGEAFYVAFDRLAQQLRVSA